MSNKILKIVAVTLFCLCFIALIAFLNMVYYYNNTSQNADNLAVSEDLSYKETSPAEASNNIDDFENSYIYAKLRTLLKEALSDNGYDFDISYNRQNKLVVILMYSPVGMFEEFKYGSSLWSLTTKNIYNISNIIYSKIIEFGYYDVSCLVALLSDEDPDTILYETLNGEEYYN